MSDYLDKLERHGMLSIEAKVAESVPQPGPMPSEESIHLAAQCWCDPETSSITMDERLAFAFAKRLDAVMKERDESKENLNELTMYIPKVPTQPYEKELAKALVEQDAEIQTLKKENDRLFYAALGTINTDLHQLCKDLEKEGREKDDEIQRLKTSLYSAREQFALMAECEGSDPEVYRTMAKAALKKIDEAKARIPRI